jgi:methionyl-tRNA synthetase
MLHAAGWSLPKKVHIHGFLNVGGEKMSKSKGTFIKASTYLAHLDPSFLRYYYASKLSNKLEDIDLNLEEFVQKINSDLVGKVVNLASRTAKFIQSVGLSEEYPHDGGLFKSAAAAGETIAAAYQNCDYARAMRLIMELADRANPFVENAQPWVLNKDPEQRVRLQEVCTIALNLFRQLVVYLSPVLPDLRQRCEALFDDPITDWEQSQTPLVGKPIAKFKHMLQRVQPESIQKMTDESKAEFEAETAANSNAAETASDAPTANSFGDTDEALKAEPMTETCTIEDFMKIDLRVARVVSAEQVPDARKLLKLTLSLGGDVEKTVFAGIKAAYEPEQLVGRLVVCVANLKPRQMKFGLSEGMVTAAGGGGTEVFVLRIDDGAKPGMRVH